MNDKPSAAPALKSKTPWAWAVGTFFGVGLLKPGPGTWASVAAVALWYGAAQGLSGGGESPQPLLTLIAALIATAIGIPAATRVARESGREDPGHVVIDEVAGQWTTLIVCHPDWGHALLALLLFRFFDITKPWPIRKLESLPGGWGIMLDDLAAGVLGLMVLVALQRWWA